jgi:hypothetical protein
MENSFKSVIESSKSILIILPTKPRFDQVAAALSLYLSLRSSRDIQIFSPSAMTVEFNRLIGVNKINSEIGNKNLVIRFVDYRANDIERVSYDIEDGQFRLTVIPKQKIHPPGKNQIELAYSGISADTVIIVGGSSESHFPVISSKELAGANIVHIGTSEITLSSGKSYISFSRRASSVSEIVFGLLAEGGFPADADISTNLLMGIEESSKGFSSGEVNASTFAIVSELMRLGGKRQPAVPIQTNLPPGSIPGKSNRSQNQQTQQLISQQLDTKHEDQATKDQLGGSPPKDWLKPKIIKGGYQSSSSGTGNRPTFSGDGENRNSQNRKNGNRSSQNGSSGGTSTK